MAFVDISSIKSSIQKEFTKRTENLLDNAKNVALNLASNKLNFDISKISSESPFGDLGGPPLSLSDWKQLPENRIFRKQGKNQLQGLQYPSTLRDEYLNISFMEYERPKPNVKPSTSTNLNIKLPLPRDLQEVHSVRLDPQETRLVGQLASNIENVYKAMTGAAPSGQGFQDFKNIINSNNAASTAGVLAQLGTTALSSVGGAVGMPMDTVLATVGQYAGGILNPQISVFFQGVDIRPPMEFSWLMSPRNEKEMATIKKIIKEMRKRILPKPSEGESQPFLSYPNMVELKLYPWAKDDDEQDIMPRYKRGFIEAMHVNYTPSGLSLFKDDNPVFVILSFVFQEIEIWTAEDYGEKEKYGSEAINTVLESAKEYAENIFSG